MAAKIGDVELVASGYGFTLEDSEGVPAIIFAFLTEQRARDAAKSLQAALVDAVILPAAGFGCATQTLNQESNMAEEQLLETPVEGPSLTETRPGVRINIDAPSGAPCYLTVVDPECGDGKTFDLVDARGKIAVNFTFPDTAATTEGFRGLSEALARCTHVVGQTDFNAERAMAGSLYGAAGVLREVYRPDSTSFAFDLIDGDGSVAATLRFATEDEARIARRATFVALQTCTQILPGVDFCLQEHWFGGPAEVTGDYSQ